VNEIGDWISVQLLLTNNGTQLGKRSHTHGEGRDTGRGNTNTTP
jgi:hypothetical protein